MVLHGSTPAGLSQWDPGDFKPSLCVIDLSGLIHLFADNENRYQNTHTAAHRQDKKYRIYMT
jgi:hypothetical protein